MFGANPLIESNTKQIPMDYAADFDISHVLQRATRVKFVKFRNSKISRSRQY